MIFFYTIKVQKHQKLKDLEKCFDWSDVIVKLHIDSTPFCNVDNDTNLYEFK